MKTDPKNSNASGLLSHPEQAADTNPRRLYEVTVHRTDYRALNVRVKAESEQEAASLAEELAQTQDDSFWNVADRDCYAYSVEKVTEGGQGDE
jgi:hypothetical protein